MNVRHKPTKRKLNGQQGHDEPMEHFGRGTVAQPISHKALSRYLEAALRAVSPGRRTVRRPAQQIPPSVVPNSHDGARGRTINYSFRRSFSREAIDARFVAMAIDTVLWLSFVNLHFDHIAGRRNLHQRRRNNEVSTTRS
jgi:hypothetical protein